MNDSTLPRTISIAEAVEHPLVQETLRQAQAEQGLVDVPQPVGQGGAGIVFRVQNASGRVMGLKVPNYGKWPFVEQAFLRRRLINEAQLLGIVQSHSVPRLVHCEEHGSYLLREFVDGEPLNRFKLQVHGEALGRLVTALLECTRHLFAGFHERSDRPYVLRDVKLENYVGRSCTEWAVVYVDVGGILPEDRVRGDDKKGLLGNGRANARSPEFLLNDVRTLDRRMDYFALGATVYELVTGDFAYSNREANRERVLGAYLAEYPGVARRVEAALLRLSIAPEVIDFVVQCLHPIAAERPDRFIGADASLGRGRFRLWIRRRFGRR